MSKKPTSSSPAPASVDRLGSPASPTPTSPPPATGGTHVWNPSLGDWETLEETIQPWDERHPDNVPAAPSEQPLKDA